MNELQSFDRSTLIRQVQQTNEIRAALALVGSGRANGVSISGFDFEGLEPELRQEAEAAGLRLDLELLPEGGWYAHIRTAPSSPDEHPAEPTELRAPSPETPTKPPRRVLLVEDDATLAHFIKVFLEGHGVLVQVAESEEEAETALEAETPGLLLLDINLPGRSGWSLLNAPAYRTAGRPATVILSATNIYPSRLRDSGAQGYLPKPFGMNVLLSTVERMLSGPQASQNDDQTNDQALILA